MRRDWVVGIGSGLIVAFISTIAAWLIPSVPDLGSLWRRYWPVAVGVPAGVLWLGGYWLWRKWRRQQEHLGLVNQRLSRLEEWKRQGGGDTIEAIAHRALQSGIDSKRGGMDVKP